MSAGTDEAAGPRGVAIWPVFAGTPGKGLCVACKRLRPGSALTYYPGGCGALWCRDRAACDAFRAPRPLPRSVKGPGSWIDEWAAGEARG